MTFWVQSAVIIDVIVDVNTGIKNGIFSSYLHSIYILYYGVVLMTPHIAKLTTSWVFHQPNSQFRYYPQIHLSLCKQIMTTLVPA